MADPELVRAYNDGRYLIALVDFGVELLFLVGFLALGWHRRLWARLSRFHKAPSGRTGQALARVLGPEFRAALLFAAAFLLLEYLVGLPVSIWSRAHGIAYGLATDDWARWSGDQLKAVALGLPLTLLLVAGLFPLARRLPRTWWLALGLGAGLVLLAYQAVAPYQVHLYHRLEPLAQRRPELAEQVVALARRAGVSLGEVLVVDAGRVTAALDAYVAGRGPSRRLVLFDTLIDSAPEPEILAAVAHELGHRLEEDPWHEALLGVLGAVAVFGLVKLLLAALRRIKRLRVGPDNDPVNLPALFLCLALTVTLFSLAGNALSRDRERAADRRAVELLGDPAPLLALYDRLAARNLADPDPPAWVVLLMYDHPPMSERRSLVRTRGR